MDGTVYDALQIGSLRHVMRIDVDLPSHHLFEFALSKDKETVEPRNGIMLVGICLTPESLWQMRIATILCNKLHTNACGFS
jgi:hypothetical protein